MKKEDCIFCKIANGEIPSATVYESSEFRVIMDISPATRGHCLIITKEHYEDVYEIGAETAGKLFSLATVVARCLKEEVKCEGMNIIQNNGKIAGQTVFHFHLHLIPRYSKDQVNIMWKNQEISKQELEEMSKNLRKRI